MPYLKTFKERGYEVDVAIGGPPVAIEWADRVIQLPLVKSMLAPANLAAVRGLRREIHRQHYDAVFVHTSLAAFFTRLALMGLRHRPRTVCVVHGYLFDDHTPPVLRLLLTGAEKLTAPVTDWLLTMNAWDDAFARRHRLGRNLRMIPGMGVDFSRLKGVDPAQAAALRRELGFSPDDFLLIYPAEFSERKNQALLLRAAAELPANVKLLLPGQGALLEDCRALARNLGMERRVVFPGQVSDIPLWLAAADAAVSSSRIEGLPFNIMEAMGAGLPVVATDIKGHADLIEDAVTGLLFPSGDIESCRAQILRLLADPALRQSLGARARASIAPYALPQAMPKVLACYDEALRSADASDPTRFQKRG